MKLLDERGRKFTLTLVAVGFFLAVFASTFVKVLVPALRPLDLAVLERVAAGVAGLVAIYAGANTLSKQAEARIAERTTTTETFDPDV